MNRISRLDKNQEISLLYLQYNTCSFNQIYRYIEPEIIVSVSIYRFTKIEKTKLCVRNPIEMTERDGGSRGKKMSRPFHT